MGESPVPAVWEPRNPHDGDFRFKAVNRPDFSPDNWPADPGEYRPTSHFIRRYRNHERVFTGDVINNAITSGEVVPALDDCAAFYDAYPGVVYYVIVGWDQSYDAPRKLDKRVVVTGWGWVFDRDAALDSGRFSSRTLTKMQKTNEQLFGDDPDNKFWMEYFDTMQELDTEP